MNTVRVSSLSVFLLAASNAAAQPAAPLVPLCPGLRIVTAVDNADGDYESIKTIETVTADAVRLKYSTEKMDWGDMLGTQPPKLKRHVTTRAVRRDDMQNATSYLQEFHEKLPQTIPTTTALGTSKKVLETLKKKGEADFAIFFPMTGDEPWSLERDKHPNVWRNQMPGKLKRIGTVKLPVIVNDQPTHLPAVHAQGEFGGWNSEFFFLDYPDNPLTLKYRIGIGLIPPLEDFQKEQCRNMSPAPPHCSRPGGGDKMVLQVVKIAHRCDVNAPAAQKTAGGGKGGAPPGAGGGKSAGAGGGGASGDVAARLEKALENDGRAELPDIFFGFGTDEIREESEQALRDIAEILRRNPDWKLKIEGHTDSVADDAKNLDLSRRRAAAVKNALVSKHKIPAARLTTDGLGESKPRATNQTLEGRARNRRVELVRNN